jgi:putative Mn2+ efflux pump MntP
MTSTRTEHTRHHRTPVQLAALVFGVVFLLVGVAGFIPGITTNYDTMQFAGHHSEAMLLGIFQVSILHNIVHLLYGVVGVAMARTGRLARLYLLVGGVVYLALWIYGLVIGHRRQLVAPGPGHHHGGLVVPASGPHRSQGPR